MDQISHNKIKTDFFEFTLDEESGEWIAKALPIKALKIHHNEQPAYKVVEEMEERYEKNFQQHLSHALKDIVQYLKVH